MRYRLVAAHHRRGGGVLRSFGMPGRRVVRWYFNPQALAEEDAREATPVDAALGELELAVDDAQKNLGALRNAFRDHKTKANARLAALEKALLAGNAGQSPANDATSLIGAADGQQTR